MPDGDCLSALRALRAAGRSTPALLLTAARSVSQRVEGLDSGADDYLTKPFSIVEVVARARALLRRPRAVRADEFLAGNIRLNIAEKRAFVNEKEMLMTANEWRLIAFLLLRPKIVFTRAQIMKEVGISDSAGEVAVDHLVSRLRQKLRSHDADYEIKTVRGIGFSWGR
jgi:DNA-binding response OmpR family regulator